MKLVQRKVIPRRIMLPYGRGMAWIREACSQTVVDSPKNKDTIVKKGQE